MRWIDECTENPLSCLYLKLEKCFTVILVINDK